MRKLIGLLVEKLIILLFASFFMVALCNSVDGQTPADSLADEKMTIELKGDTLVTSTGLKIFVGEKLIIGNPAGEAGRYRSIISRNAALVPSIWGQTSRSGYAIENYVDSKKSKERLLKSLIPGNVLTIKGIGISRTGKPHFYMIILSSDSDVYKCDIQLALMVKELALQSPRT